MKMVNASMPTNSRSCVHVNYLALYDRLVEEERKEFGEEGRDTVGDRRVSEGDLEGRCALQRVDAVARSPFDS